MLVLPSLYSLGAGIMSYGFASIAHGARVRRVCTAAMCRMGSFLRHVYIYMLAMFCVDSTNTGKCSKSLPTLEKDSRRTFFDKTYNLHDRDCCSEGGIKCTLTLRPWEGTGSNSSPRGGQTTPSPLRTALVHSTGNPKMSFFSSVGDEVEPSPTVSTPGTAKRSPHLPSPIISPYCWMTVAWSRIDHHTTYVRSMVNQHERQNKP